MKEVEDLENALTSDIHVESYTFAQLDFCLALVQYFITMFPFIHAETVMYSLCHDEWGVCDPLFDFDFTKLSS